MTSTPIRVGLIGAGSRGTSVAERFEANEDLTIVSVADVDETAVRAAAERFAIDRSNRFTGADRLISSDGLDAVIVATPHTLHFEQVTAALDEGLAVFCEKPLTTNTEHALELAQRAGDESTLMVGYKFHLHPVYAAGRRRWADGPHRPTAITAAVSQDWLGLEDTWRQNPELSGGGMLYDTGSHVIDALLWMTELTPKTVTAQMIHASDGVDVNAALTVGFEGDELANVSVFGDSAHPRDNLVRVSDTGGLVYLREGFIERDVTAVSPEGEPQALATPADLPTQAEAFVDAVRSGSRPPASAHDALRTTALTEAVYEAAATGGTAKVDIPPVATE